MSPDKMVHMVNQIAAFFRSQPHGDPVERVAQHLRDFWDPRMRAQLRAHLAEGGEGLDSIARTAAARI